MKHSSIVLLTAVALTAVTGAASAQKALILVRHAEIEAPAMAEPKSVPLTEAGQERAKRLASMLKDSDIDSIYVTDFVRTNKTAEPLSVELKKEMTVLPKGESAKLVERLRKDHSDQTVLLVGHKDTLPELLKGYGYPENLTIEAEDYGNMFVVVPKGKGAATVLHLRY